MGDPGRCPRCDQVITSDAAEALCVACLYESQLRPPEDLRTEGSASLTFPGPGASTAARGLLIRTFGDYEILEEVAQGGMGVVFKARQHGLNRLVALKVINTGVLATAEARRRFLREAQTAANLVHPAVIPVYEIGEQDGHLFFSMQFVEGPTLAHVIRAGTLKGPDAARIVAKVARALHYAHQRGVLHRDVKPGNILLDRDGEPHLGDFGVALVTTSAEAITGTLGALGTPAYMAPEQARGGDGVLTTAVDVFGLGAVLYECLAARPPHCGSTHFEILRKVCEEDPVPPSILKPGVDPDLETVCLKCLEKEPERRYPAALSLAEELERWAREEPITARRLSPWQRLSKWSRRRRPVAILLVGLFLALVMGVGGILHSAREATRARRHSDLRTARGLLLEGWALVDQHREFDALPRLLDAWELQNGAKEDTSAHAVGLGMVTETMPRVVSAADAGHWIHCVRRRPGANEIALAGMTPDGRGVAQIWSLVRGAATGVRLTFPAPVTAVDFSPDGARLATGCSDGHLQVWDVGTGHPLTAPLSHTERLTCVRFSPDGRRILAGCSNGSSIAPGEVVVWDSLRGLREWDFKELGLNVATAEFGPGPDEVMVGSYNHLALVLHTQNAHEGRALIGGSAPSYSTWCIAYTPDRRSLVVGGSFGGDASQLGVRVIDPVSGHPRLPLLAHRAQAVALAFSPDGTRLASAGLDQSVRLWDPVTGAAIGPELQHYGTIGQMEFSPDGERLVTACSDGYCRVWNVRNGALAASALPHQRAVVMAALDADPALIHVIGADGLICTWRLGGPTRKEVYRDASHPATSAVYLDEGREILVGTRSSQARRLDKGGRVVDEIEAPFAVTTIETAAAAGTMRLLGSHPPGSSSLVSTAGRLQRMAPPQGPESGELRVDRVHGVSPDGERLAVDDGRGNVLVMEVRSRRVLSRHHLEVTVPRVVFSRDGGCAFLTGNEGVVHRLPEAGGVEVRARLHWLPTENLSWGRAGHSKFSSIICDLALSADGKWLATGSVDRTARVWDALTLEPRTAPLRHAGVVTHVKFSGDGKCVLSVSEDRTVRLWNVGTGEAMGAPMEHEGLVSRAVMDERVKWVATASRDGSARLWDMTSGLPVSPRLLHDAAVLDVAIHPEGREILTVTEDGKVWRWPIVAADQGIRELRAAYRLHADDSATAAEFVDRWGRLESERPRR